MEMQHTRKRARDIARSAIYFGSILHSYDEHGKRGKRGKGAKWGKRL